MKHIKTVWVSIYKCDRCGREFDGADRYNDYGKDQFPNVDAPPTMAHQCTPVCVGIARLVGLTERVDKANDQVEFQEGSEAE